MEGIMIHTQGLGPGFLACMSAWGFWDSAVRGSGGGLASAFRVWSCLTLESVAGIHSFGRSLPEAAYLVIPLGSMYPNSMYFGPK